MIHYNGLISVISKCKLQLYPIDPVCLLNTGFEYLLTFHRHTLLVCSLVFDIVTTNREKTKMEKKRGIVSSFLLELLYHCILDYENKDYIYK